MYGQTMFNDKMKIKQGDLNPAADGPAPREALESMETGREGPYEVDAGKKTSGSMHVDANFNSFADDNKIYG